MEKYSQVIFDKNTVEFVTVAAEYCGFLERARDMKRYDFVDTALKILPLLYLKATLLPPCEPIGEDEPEIFVTEEDYELIRRTVAGVLGAKDDYLEVFLPDMAYSDTPIKKCISEDLADIYQDLKDFISVFQLGLNETMNDSLVVCKEHFREFWGQRLVNTMRALHDVKYTPADDDVLLAPDAVFAGFGVLAGVYTGAVKDGIAAISAFGAELSAGACEAAGVFIAAGVCALGAELPSETIFSSVITPSPVFCPDIRETRLLPFTPITAAKSIQAATEPYFFQPKAKLLLLRASRRI